MAKMVGRGGATKKVINAPHLRTSIGKSANSRPKGKHQRKQFKAYRGQG